MDIDIHPRQLVWLILSIDTWGSYDCQLPIGLCCASVIFKILHRLNDTSINQNLIATSIVNEVC